MLHVVAPQQRLKTTFVSENTLKLTMILYKQRKDPPKPTKIACALHNINILAIAIATLNAKKTLSEYYGNITKIYQNTFQAELTVFSFSFFCYI